MKLQHIGIAGLLVASAFQLVSCQNKTQQANEDKQLLFIGDDIAVVQTTYGKIRGYVLRDIFQFKGIPYGAPTSGKNRFMPPQKPEAWDDVLPTLVYGNAAPQVVPYDRNPNSVAAFVDHWNYDLISEDCLRLNVWTPGINDGGKRPVLVWLHGGGFSSGNAIEQDGYGGENLARFGDIVFCSVNHRLNAFGFSNFSKVGGEAFKHSGNVGMLDIIAALEWVRDNIAQFGGDPHNVTIMGQSGGGSKVSAIATMKSAKGLINKAVCLSGNSINAADKTYSEELGAYILKKAGLQPSQIGKLQEMPWETYYKLATSAASEFNKTNSSRGRRGGFSPVADGVDLPLDGYFAPGDTTIPNVPMIYCTTFQERNPNRDDASLESITLEGVIQKLERTFGTQTRAVVEAYAKQFPSYRPIEIWAILTATRVNVVRAADTKLRQGAPVYMAWFGWQPPLFDGRLRAFHCLDICFWFYNTDVMLSHTGGGARPRDLSQKMASSLVSFMRTGDPNCDAIPSWPLYTAEKGETMILNDICEVKNDPDREARATITQ